MKQLLQNIFRPLLKLVCEIYPKNKNIILIGTPNGKFYNDNSKYFFEFLIANKSHNFEVFLLVKNYKLYSILKNKFGNHILYAFSFNALITYLRSKFVLLSNGNDDIFPFLPSTKKQIVINMWHGIPIKTIGNISTKPGEKINLNLNYFLVSSETEKNSIFKAFKGTIRKDQFMIFGIPRNDIFFNKKNKNNGKIIILYLPTFRKTTSVEFFPFPDFNGKELKEFLLKSNIEIIIKPHKNDSTNQRLLDIVKENPYVKLKTSINNDIDIQHMLLDCDILLTDYSSVYLDFLLLDRPIIFIPYDIEEYKKTRGFLFENFDEITCGDKVFTQKEFINSIKNNIENPSKDSLNRKRIRQKFHLFNDGKASDRLLDFIKSHS